MKRSRTFEELIGICAALAFLCQAAVFSAYAQLVIPTHISCPTPVHDEFGRLLQGTAKQPGDAVRIYIADDGVIYPPNKDGRPHPLNRLVEGGAVGIGHLALPSSKQPGSFAIALTSALKTPYGTTVFVRVFNAANPENATFYTDSDSFKLRKNAFYELTMNTTELPIDAGDDDNDGLSNSWEDSLGLDRYSTDTDGDGMTDYKELLAGTDPAASSSVLALSRPVPVTTDIIQLTWPAIIGRTYRIYYAHSSKGTLTFNEVGLPLVATNSVMVQSVDISDLNAGMFRITVEVPNE